MSAPVAYFKYTSSGLSFTFKDGSVGATSWSWDFGDGGNSIVQNPPAHVYAAEGIYEVKLTATNAEGSSTYIISVLASVIPSLSLPIKEVVRAQLPSGLVFDDVLFEEVKKKWMLYLQEAAGISDADVFNELKWTPMYRILIGKLIIYDLVLQATESNMTAFIQAQQLYNQNINNSIATNTVQVADYIGNIDLDGLISGPNTVTALHITINGQMYTSGALTTVQGIVDYLNSLNKGVFLYDPTSNQLKSLGNVNIVTNLNIDWTSIGDSNIIFGQSNVRVVPINQVISISGSSGGKGPMKSLETGPSKAEWYDASTYWSNLFKGSGLSGSGSVFSSLLSDICMYANKLGVFFTFCGDRKYPGLPLVHYFKKC